MSDFENHEDPNPQNATNQDTTCPTNFETQKKMNPGDNADQSRTVPGDNANNEETSSGDVRNQVGTNTGDNTNEESTCPGDTRDQMNAYTGEGENEESRSPGNAATSSTAENTASLTAAIGSSILQQNSSRPLSTYHSPYATVYDPTGHYESAYNRILGGSRSDQQQSKEDDTRPSSRNEDQRRFDHTQYYRDSTTFTADKPANIRRGNYETSLNPENFRFGSSEPMHNQSTRVYGGRTSPEFGEFESIDGNNPHTPLPKPVVVGRVVQRGRKRSRVQDDDEYEEPVRRKSPSPFRRVPIPDDDTNYSRMDGGYRDIHSQQRMPTISRFRTPWAETAASRFRLEDVYTEDEEYARDGNYRPEDNYTRDSDSELFVSWSHPSLLDHSNRPDRSRTRYDQGARRTTGGNHGHGSACKLRTDKPGYFNVFGQRLEPSRYSGVPMPWDVATDPEMIDQTEVSDASLLKRNIARGEGKKICKRGCGASDPENIAIVNMKEFDKLSFDEIARKLNDKRVKEGKNPSLSAVGVNGRYNRTAPLLFSSQGKEFIPLSKRKGRAKEFHDAYKDGVVIWDDELDLVLVNCVKDVEAAKWTTVATLFQERTGKSLNATAAALRHSLL